MDYNYNPSFFSRHYIDQSRIGNALQRNARRKYVRVIYLREIIFSNLHIPSAGCVSGEPRKGSSKRVSRKSRARPASDVPSRVARSILPFAVFYTWQCRTSESITTAFRSDAANATTRFFAMYPQLDAKKNLDSIISAIINFTRISSLRDSGERMTGPCLILNIYM